MPFKESLHPCPEFSRVERLCHVIICASSYANNLVSHLSFGCKHYYGDFFRECISLELPAYLDAVNLRHHEVEYDKVGHVLAYHLKSLLAVGCLNKIMVFSSKNDGYKAPDVRLILCNKNLLFFAGADPELCFPDIPCISHAPDLHHLKVLCGCSARMPCACCNLACRKPFRAAVQQL